MFELIYIILNTNTEIINLRVILLPRKSCLITCIYVQGASRQSWLFHQIHLTSHQMSVTYVKHCQIWRLQLQLICYKVTNRDLLVILKSKWVTFTCVYSRVCGNKKYGKIFQVGLHRSYECEMSM